MGNVISEVLLTAKEQLDEAINKAKEVNTDLINAIIDGNIEEIKQNIENINNRIDNMEVEINIKLFGAKGDGTTDDSEAIKNAIDSLYNAGNIINGKGKIVFPAGRYMIKEDSVLNLKSNIDLVGENGAILDFSDRTVYTSETNNFLINAIGSIGTEINLTADVSKGDYDLYLDTTNLKEGDLIQITSNAKWEETDSSIYCNIGELAVVNNIESSTKMQITNSSNDNYLISDNARVYKITPIENVTIKGFTIKGQGRNINPINDADFGIGFTYCRNVLVENCVFEDIDTRQLEFRSCYNFKADNCHFKHSKYTTLDSSNNVIIPNPPKSQDTRGAVQYQVRCADSCMYGTIVNCTGKNGRHFFNTGHSNRKLDGTSSNSRNFLFGINRFITVENCKSINTWHAGFSTHNDAEHIEFVNCEAISSAMAGFNPRSNYNTVKDCKAINCSGIGIYLSDNVRNSIIKNNEIINCGGGIYFYSYNNLDFEDNFIEKNTIIKCKYGIHLASNSTITQTGEFIIKNNTIKDCGNTGNNSGIRTLFNNGNFTIDDNLIIGGTVVSILLQNANNVVLSNNLLKNGNRALLVETVNKINAVNNNSIGFVSTSHWNEIYKATSYTSLNNSYTNSDGTILTVQDNIIRSGTTSQRPKSGLKVGLIYLDTTLNKLICYNGTTWIDATGIEA